MGATAVGATAVGTAVAITEHRARPADSSSAPPLPPELVAERARIARLAADAARRASRGRFRRHALLPAAVASGVIASTGLLSAWARATTPVAPTATHAHTVATVPEASSERVFLRQLAQALRADQQAIAGLGQGAASAFSASAVPAGAGPAGTGPAGAGDASSAGAPPLAPALPPIPLPAISAPPAVHATTGASGI